MELPGAAVGQGQIKPTKAIAAKIETDMAAGHFDHTLEAYRPKLDQKIDPVLSIVELWRMFTEWSRGQGATERYLQWRFPPIAANLRRWGGDIVSEDTARDFLEYLRTRQSTTTANRNLSFLRVFGRWCVEQKHWQANHFEKLKPAKVQSAPKRDNPFAVDEVRLFLSTIKTDTHYFSYHDFCYCLFYLGTRPSELIGLRWGAVDFTRRMIVISESLSRGG